MLQFENYFDKCRLKNLQPSHVCQIEPGHHQQHIHAERDCGHRLHPLGLVAALVGPCSGALRVRASRAELLTRVVYVRRCLHLLLEAPHGLVVVANVSHKRRLAGVVGAKNFLTRHLSQAGKSFRFGLRQR